ncbi:hypothetical protein AB0758_30780 [Tolypothrix bouteillei VB521301_2]|uniref:hypothetical protein n=1 Tax=Tolypothrix bouteillei TaxID=1246981 RepID=UPI0038B4DE3C
MHIHEVPAQHLGLLYINQGNQTTTPSRNRAWWQFGRSLPNRNLLTFASLNTCSLRVKTILSKDKVPLRLKLNYWLSRDSQTPLRAKNGLSDINTCLYKELYSLLYVVHLGKSIDAILEDKGAIDRSVSEYIPPENRRLWSRSRLCWGDRHCSPWQGLRHNFE